MVHLVIDTCVWIDLCKSKKLSELRPKITLLVKQKKVRLILPSIVKEEWNKQKSRILEEQNQSVKAMIRNARALSEYFDPESGDKLKGMLANLQKDAIEKIASAGIQEIEHLFDYPTTVVPEITDKVKLQAADFALAKKAPFGNKNSMADALLIFSAVEYIAKEGLTDSIFVSSNRLDFSSPSDSAQIHEDLRELFESCGIKYFINIGLAINKVETDLVSAETIQQIETIIAVDAVQEAFRSIQAYNQLIENFQNVGELSSISEALKTAAEANRQFTEAFRSAASLSVVDQLSRSMREFDQWMKSIRMAANLPGITEALKTAAEANRQFTEAFRSAASLSVVDQLSRSMREYDQSMKSIRMAGELPAIFRALKTTDENAPETGEEKVKPPDSQETVPKTGEKEVAPPDGKKDNEPKTPDGTNQSGCDIDPRPRRVG